MCICWICNSFKASVSLEFTWVVYLPFLSVEYRSVVMFPAVGNANTQDLWASLQEAANQVDFLEAGEFTLWQAGVEVNIAAVMDAWTNLMGYPVPCTVFCLLST